MNVHKDTIVSIGGRKKTLADKTVYPYVSINTNFDNPLLSLDSTFHCVFEGLGGGVGGGGLCK
jgi:hypothetical protein